MGKTSSKRILNVTVRMIADDDADASYLEQDEFEDRLRQYRDGQFGFIGIRAEAEITQTANNIVHRITSGGLWGIEDDSGAAYLNELADEQLADLRDELRALGFSTRAIGKAFENVER